ncbi:MAG: DUF3489 domain-containing protein [Pseudomonadota bacterium]|jgi:hypothetical protein
MTTSLTERQLNLITRAHRDTNGLIEPLLELKGGARLKMITSLAQRGLIEQMDGQWRLTRAALALIKGEAQESTTAAQPSIAEAQDTEAAVATAQQTWIEAAVKANDAKEAASGSPKVGFEGKPRRRANSKQALVIEMLRRPEGATVRQISEATGWQAHTVRGALAGALKKKLGLAIVSEKPKGGERVYRVS